MIPGSLSALLYLASAVLFILALRGLSSPSTSRQGNLMGMAGMTVAVLTTLGGKFGSPEAPVRPLLDMPAGILAAIAIGGGAGWFIVRMVRMTQMPQLVAGFHSLVGLAAVLVAAAAFLSPEAYGIDGADGRPTVAARIEMVLGLAIGAVTFSGSVIAFGKLHGLLSGNPVVFPFQHHLNALVGLVIAGLAVLFVISPDPSLFMLLTALSFLIGFLLIIPIGGADMPVVVSMLNSYSGWAAAGIGFTLGNVALIVTGALVGASGAILSYIMCKGMNRSLLNVIAGGFGSEGGGQEQSGAAQAPFRQGSAEDAAFVLSNARKVIIVPGYGMAVARAQHALGEMAGLLKKKGVHVRFAIHPVAGRMPGHMNVLLAEASVPYEDVLELEEANPEFRTADVSFVIGANDVTNPAARDDPGSPLYGMPVLDVDRSGTVLFVKRTMGTGYAGADNRLFYEGNTTMLLGDARKMVEQILKFME